MMLDGNRKMAASFATGGQSPTSVSRTLERVFEDAQYSGEVLLCGRNLKEYPKFASKYDLADTVYADISKNRFTEIPEEIGEYASLERLNCYHNLIRSIPENVGHLQVLTHLNLSRNQLTMLPAFLCQLPMLEVLLANNNKLVSLPPEICKLERLMDLDVSCNEISRLPIEIGKLPLLRRLNVRKNLLVEIPPEISQLELRRIDFSANKISSIPIVFRSMNTLEEMILDHNPLTTPPAHVCTKGKAHVMKFLQKVADRNKALLNDNEMKWNCRKSFPQPAAPTEEFTNLSPEQRWKRHMLSSDSGYIDGSDKSNWSLLEVNKLSPPAWPECVSATPLAPCYEYIMRKLGNNTNNHHHHLQQSTRLYDNRIEVVNDLDEANCLALKAAEAAKEQRQGRDEELQPKEPPREIPKEAAVNSEPKTSSLINMEDTFTRRSPYNGHKQGIEDPGQELQRQKSNYERQKKHAVHLRMQQEEAERELKQPKSLDSQREEMRRLNMVVKEKQDQEMIRQRLQGDQEEGKVESQPLPDAVQQQQLAEMQKSEELRKIEPVSRVPLQEKEKATVKRDKTEETLKTKVDNNNRKYGLGTRAVKDEKKTTITTTSSTSQYRRIGSAEPSKIKKQTSDSASASNHLQKNGVPDENMNPSPASSNAPSRSSSTSSIHSSTNDKTVSKTLSGSRLRLDKSATSTPSASSNVVRRTKPGEKSGSSQVSSTNSKIAVTTSSRLHMSGTKSNHVTPEEEFRLKHEALMNQQKHESQILKQQLEEQRTKTASKDLVGMTKRSPGDSSISYSSSTAGTKTATKTGKSLGSGNKITPTGNRRTTKLGLSSSSPSSAAPPPPHQNDKGLNRKIVLSANALKLLEDLKDSDPNFTIRRHHDQARGEIQQVESLRNTIQARLKVTLPDNLPEALRDGVVLCHLVNQIRPRAVATIHVPSPAVPQLTMAKCRRNVEHFLEACRKIGVDQAHLCACDDIVEMLRPARVAFTVEQLMCFPRLTAKDYLVTYFCAIILLSNFLLLWIFPPS
ncbi:leucine-rich repeat and calponin homology domain-containing protein 2-like isoform X9 [Octopus sinensis]|uniref:Leucine-rich repeat and calponin homology domain-containing protein 2-like isoform X9 n=1 Tax=Octopus sinensis TaxID=2607531 RepID=A0A7E6EU37_9MOLL|nr:leucine-rich repeat and calponin homology domain-containing protein 2-like isoform X9 [Octopus sinensis]